MINDGSVWGVPVSVVARNRAEYYAPRDFGGDVERSLKEDTLPLFEAYDNEALDWLRNNMNPCDIANHLVRLRHPDSYVSIADQWFSDEHDFIVETLDI